MNNQSFDFRQSNAEDGSMEENQWKTDLTQSVLEHEVATDNSSEKYITIKQNFVSTARD
jgi:hypothetical protein